MGNKVASMKIVTFTIMLGFGLSLAKNVRETWIDICTDDSGNQCCADGNGMGNHTYWIIRTEGSWKEQDIECRMGKSGDTKLAVFESRRENDCVTKFLLDEYEDSTAHQYAIGAARLQFSQKLISVNSGIKVDDTYTGVYEWDRVETSIDNQDAATLAFSNWVPGNKSLIFHINVDY